MLLLKASRLIVGPLFCIYDMILFSLSVQYRKRNAVLIHGKLQNAPFVSTESVMLVLFLKTVLSSHDVKSTGEKAHEICVSISTGLAPTRSLDPKHCNSHGRILQKHSFKSFCFLDNARV